MNKKLLSLLALLCVHETRALAASPSSDDFTKDKTVGVASGISADSLADGIKPGLFHYSVGAGGVATSNDQVPFWMRANQFGNIPLHGISGILSGNIRKTYKNDNHLFDWGFGFEGRLNAGSEVQFIFAEAYAKARVGIFELRAGRSKQIMGLVDSTLSVGSFSMSGNALGVPKIELSVPEFYTLPFLGNLIAFKGNFVHGWLGTVEAMKIRQRISSVNTYFHQKSLYLRLGKPEGKIRLYGGFNHQAFWGNEKKTYGSAFKLSVLESYKYVLFGKTMDKSLNGFETGKIGNHLGSIDLGIDLIIGGINLFAYRQNFYDVGALSKLANIKDGLNGIRIENRNLTKGNFYWKKLLLEFLYTKSQAGEPDAKFTKSGDENYYNGFYIEGWSYKQIGLGTPFVSSKISTRSGFPNDPRDFFNNNRVSVLNLGIEFVIYGFSVLNKLSYSNNYGTYGTSPYGHSLGDIRSPNHGIFPKSNQFSGILDVRKDVLKGLEIGGTLALDAGELLNDCTGIILNVRKTFR